MSTSTLETAAIWLADQRIEIARLRRLVWQVAILVGMGAFAVGVIIGLGLAA